MIIKRKIPALILTALFLAAGLFWFSTAQAALTVNDIGLNYAANSTFGGTRDFRDIISNVINIAMGFLGIIAVGVMLYGGFMWMTSAGSPERVESAKKTLINGVIGLVIVISAYSITYFVISRLAGVAGPGGSTVGAVCTPACVSPESCISGLCVDTSLTTTSLVIPGTGCTPKPPATVSPTFEVATPYVCSISTPLPLGGAHSGDLITIFGGNFAANAAASRVYIFPEGYHGIIDDAVCDNDAVAGDTDHCYKAVIQSCDTTSSWINTQVVVEVPLGITAIGRYQVAVKNTTLGDSSLRLLTIGVDKDIFTLATGTAGPGLICTVPDREKRNGVVVAWGKNLGATKIIEVTPATDPATFTTSTLNFTRNPGSLTPVYIAPVYTPANFALIGDWSDTTLSTKIPFDALTGLVKVTKGGVDSNTVIQYVSCAEATQDVDCSVGTPGAPGYMPGCCVSNMCVPSSFCGEPYISGFDPVDGAKGTFVTIFGSNFGATSGRVNFIQSDDTTVVLSASTPDCGSTVTWTDSQVIVEIPAGAISGKQYTIELSRVDLRKTDTLNLSRTSFLVDAAKVRPGLCGVVDIDRGFPARFNDTLKYNGKNFTVANTFLLGGESLEKVSTSLPNVKVPDLAPGIYQAQVQVGDVYSNSIQVPVTISTVKPVIDRLDFTKGPTGQYITIFGSNFGESAGSLQFQRLSSDPSAPVNSSRINFTAVFSEPVTGFIPADVTLSSGTPLISEVAPYDHTKYNIAVNGMVTGAVTASISANVAVDEANNDSAAATSTSNTVNYSSAVADDTPPNVISINRVGSASSTNAASVVFRVTFSETIIDGVVDTSDFDLVKPVTVSATIATSAKISSSIYEVTVNSITGNGNLQLKLVDNDSITDMPGNKLGGNGTGNGNFTTGQAYTIDNTAPTVTINQASGQPETTSASPINFTAVFSEPVTGFEGSDVTKGGVVFAPVITTSEIAPHDGTTYNVAISGMTGNGSVSATIGANTATDLAGNNNTSSTSSSIPSSDNSVTYNSTTTDNDAPNVVSINLAGTSPTSADSVNFTVTFDEGVAGVDATDFSLITKGSVSAAMGAVASVSPSIYTVTVDTINGDGFLGINLDDNDSIEDLSTNRNKLGDAGVNNGNFTGQEYTIDNAAPTVTINQVSGTPILIGNFFPSDVTSKAFEFPTACGAVDYWHDDSITFKVPVLPIGMTLTAGRPLPFDIKVNTGQLSNGKNLTICLANNKASSDPDSCRLKPGICDISPKQGIIGAPVVITGEGFGSDAQCKDSLSVGNGFCKVYFNTTESSANSYTWPSTAWTENKIGLTNGLTVPVGVQSGKGLVRTVVGGEDSNSLEFIVADCRDDASICTGMPGPCCQTGALAGSCVLATKPSNPLDTTPYCKPATPELSNLRYKFTTGLEGLAAGLPIVKESRLCLRSIQSPSPFMNSDGNCVNAQISASFINSYGRPVQMDEASFNNNTIKVFKCGNGDTFDTTTCAIVQLVPSVAIESLDNKSGFLWSPTLTDMEVNTWYKVQLSDGALNNYIRSADGLWLDGDLDGRPGGDYVWSFRVGNDEKACAVSRVEVLPNLETMTSLTETVDYSASVMAQNCNLLNPNDYDWQWVSSVPTIATFLPLKYRGATSYYYWKQIATPLNQGVTLVGATPAVLPNPSAVPPILGGPLSVSDLNNRLVVDLKIPEIYSIEPADASPNPSVKNYVTIRGKNFGTSQGSSTLKFGQTAASVADCGLPWNDNKIEVRLPPPKLTPADGIKVFDKAGRGTSLMADIGNALMMFFFDESVAGQTADQVEGINATIGDDGSLTGSEIEGQAITFPAAP